MATNIASLIKIGFTGWWKNLLIILPFLFNGIAGTIITIIGILLAFPILKISPLDLVNLSEKTSSQFLQQILTSLTNTSNLVLLIVLAVVMVLIFLLVNAYFSSGAIGMINSYFKFNKKADLKDMHENGKKFLWRSFFYQLITNFVFLLILGIFFIPLLNSQFKSVLFIILFVLAIILVIVLTFFISLTQYIFVNEDSGLWQAFGKSFITVGKNFWPLLGLMILWLLISSAISIVSLIPFIGQIIPPIASSFIISPASEFSYMLFCQERKV